MQTRNLKEIMWVAVLIFAVGAALWAGRDAVRADQGAAASEGKEQPFVVEYYYKPKWGHAEEFLALFKKNHYPLLKKEMELGRIVKLSITAPRFHATEDGRWDYRVTIALGNAAGWVDGNSSNSAG